MIDQRPNRDHEPNHIEALSGVGALPAEPAQPIIEVDSVNKRYGNIDALKNVSLKIPVGVTGLLGPNGSGKSTLIKSLLGLLRVQSGTGKILGFRWPQDARIIRDHIGYLPEDDCYVAGLDPDQRLAM